MFRKINKNRLILAIILIIFGSVGRILLLDLPNVETLTVTALLAGSVLSGGYTLIVPLAMIAITDIIIGNTSIMFFTWSAWAIIGIFGWFLRKQKKSPLKFSLKLMGLGIGSSFFFYLWTNFGVWLLWPQMYPHTPAGLLQSYIMGLPFLRMNLVGNLIIVPVVSFIFLVALKYHPVIAKRLKSNWQSLVYKFNKSKFENKN